MRKSPSQGGGGDFAYARCAQAGLGVANVLEDWAVPDYGAKTADGRCCEQWLRACGGVPGRGRIRAERQPGRSDGDYDEDVSLRPPAFAQAPAQVADVAG